MQIFTSHMLEEDPLTHGGVALAAGEYEIAGTLSITRSGVVLRGEGALASG